MPPNQGRQKSEGSPETLTVVVVGGGGREHALVWALTRSPLVKQVVAMPGNAGIAEIAECVDVQGHSAGAVAEVVNRVGADLTIVGHEKWIIEGLADDLRQLGHRVLGPGRGAASLEASKYSTKMMLLDLDIPTPPGVLVSGLGDVAAAARNFNYRCAIKVDGPALGKGAYPCVTEADVLEAIAAIGENPMGAEAGIVVEGLIEGEELSVFLLCDGETAIPFGSAQDHKREYAQDEGWNTGGMGAYSPVLHLEGLEAFALDCGRRILDRLAAEARAFVGFLYVGAIVDLNGACHVLELNVRLGDPETQALLPRLETDFAALAMAAASRGLAEFPPVRWSSHFALNVVLAQEGYPRTSGSIVEVGGIEDAESVAGALVFHAGTTAADHGADSTVFSRSGRVLSVTATAGGLPQARDRAYQALAMLRAPATRSRADIGSRALGGRWAGSGTHGGPNLDDASKRLYFAVGKLARLAETVLRDSLASEDELRHIESLINKVSGLLASMERRHPSSGPEDGTAERLDSLRSQLNDLVRDAATSVDHGRKQSAPTDE